LLLCVTFWTCVNVLDECDATILKAEDGGTVFLQNDGTQQKGYTVQQLRRISIMCKNISLSLQNARNILIQVLFTKGNETW
jgi:hypothetical protein